MTNMSNNEDLISDYGHKSIYIIKFSIMLIKNLMLRFTSTVTKCDTASKIPKYLYFIFKIFYN